MSFTKQRYRLFSHILWGRKKRDYRNKYLSYKKYTKGKISSNTETEPIQLDKNVGLIKKFGM